jgi:GST-like protein
MNDFPNVKRWYREIASRPAVEKGYQVPKFTVEIPMP